ncbi:MAG: hypothetical protein IJW01_04545 [Paludibacteraceae bacterium]|nr:hypothetical protein [Paludibacteraceae bacterium]
MDNLSIAFLKEIIKKVVIHHTRNAHQKCRIYRWLLEYLIYMIARARYLPLKPRYRATLFSQFIADKTTNMDIFDRNQHKKSGTIRFIAY